jgi:hypothetical protein
MMFLMASCAALTVAYHRLPSALLMQVKESLVGMAQTKRAQQRKGKVAAVDDTDLVEDVEGFEEELEGDDEEGVQLEAFNMKVFLGG